MVCVGGSAQGLVDPIIYDSYIRQVSCMKALLLGHIHLGPNSGIEDNGRAVTASNTNIKLRSINKESYICTENTFGSPSALNYSISIAEARVCSAVVAATAADITIEPFLSFSAYN